MLELNVKNIHYMGSWKTVLHLDKIKQHIIAVFIYSSYIWQSNNLNYLIFRLSVYMFMVLCE